MTKEQKLQDIEYSFPYHYIPQYKNKFTQNYNWGWGKQYISAIEFILNEIKQEKNNIQSIADIGCGDGRFTREISNTFQDKNIMGIDYSLRAIDLAKALNPGMQFENKDIINDDIEQKFDAITLIEVFEHIPLELCHDFVRATSKLLNKKGVIFLTVPHQNKPVIKKHFQHFNYENLVKYFKDNFMVEKVEYIQMQNKLLTALTKIFVNKYWIINSKLLNNWFYNFYKKNYFFANENNCERIYLKLRKN